MPIGLDIYSGYSTLRNIQVVDGADNAMFSIFGATNKEFREIFPGPGQDMEISEDFVKPSARRGQCKSCRRSGSVRS